MEKTNEAAATGEGELEGMPPEFYDEVCAYLCSSMNFVVRSLRNFIARVIVCGYLCSFMKFVVSSLRHFIERVICKLNPISLM